MAGLNVIIRLISVDLNLNGHGQLERSLTINKNSKLKWLSIFDILYKFAVIIHNFLKTNIVKLQVLGLGVDFTFTWDNNHNENNNHNNNHNDKNNPHQNLLKETVLGDMEQKLRIRGKR